MKPALNPTEQDSRHSHMDMHMDKNMHKHIGSNHALGLLGWMAMIGDTHNRLTTAEFLHKLRRALQQGTIEVFHRQGKPVAWMIWRRPSRSTWQEWFGDAHGGEGVASELETQVWLDFWIRPFGCDARLAQMISDYFVAQGIRDARMNWHDPSVDGGVGRLHRHMATIELQGM